LLLLELVQIFFIERDFDAVIIFNNFIFYLKDFIEIGKKITTVNFAILIVSAITIVFLYLSKTQINDRFKDKLPVPIPIELIVVRVIFARTRHSFYAIEIVPH
jgi:hypothetical protein